MNADDLTDRLETLELRLMDQQAAIDELTRTLLDQEQMLRLQQKTIQRLEQLLQSLAPANSNTPGEEPPPPHY